MIHKPDQYMVVLLDIIECLCITHLGIVYPISMGQLAIISCKRVLRREPKMGTGNCLFFAGKIGFHAQGLEFIVKKTIENGDGIEICARESLGE